MWTAPDIPKAPQVVLGKYRLLVKLGQGGMGDVYLAATEGLGGVGKLVVVKRLRNIEDPQFVAMFIDEARIARKLSHPNIVQTYEIGREASDHLIVMEYLDGPTLWRLRRAAMVQGGVPWPISIQIVCGVLEGLHYAHELRAPDGRLLHIVHRDLSAENVIVTQLGECKILDFGIAKAADSIVQTQAGFVKGRLHNMPPEQLRGPRVDRRADVFAAGVMLWEGLAGRALWGTLGNVAISNRLMNGDLPSLRELSPGVPDELLAICEKALAPRVENRFQTAHEMQAALVEYLERQGQVVTRAEVAEFVEPLFRDDREKIDQIIREQLDQDGARYSVVTQVPRSELEPAAPVRTPSGARGLAGMTPPGSGALAAARPGGAVKWVTAVIALAAAAAVGLWLWQTRGSLSSPPPMARVSADEAAAKYVVAAEQLVAHKSYEAARGLLAKASALEITDPELNIRLARLRDSLDTAALVKEAAVHLDNQRWRAAIDTARRALERHPENREAREILVAARDQLQPPAAPPSTASSRAHPRGQGRERAPKKTAPGPRLAQREPAANGDEAIGDPAAAIRPPIEQTAPAEVPRTSSPPTIHDASAAPTARLIPAAQVAAADPAKSRVAVPTLPRAFVASNPEQLRLMCARVEGLAVSLAGVTPDFAHGFTARLQAAVDSGEEIYPVAIYYYIVRQFNRHEDRGAATAELVSLQRTGTIRKLRDLPAIEPGH